jgi:hypothetical protein
MISTDSRGNYDIKAGGFTFAPERRCAKLQLSSDNIGLAAEIHTTVKFLSRFLAQHAVLLRYSARKRDKKITDRQELSDGP